MWLFPKLCPAVQIISFGPRTSSKREPGTHLYCCHRVVPCANPATLAWHTHQLLSIPGLATGHLWACPQPGWAGLVALTWPDHWPSVELHVHLCPWKVQGLQDVSVCVDAWSCP